MDDSNGSGFGDILSTILDAGQTAYSDYALSSNGIIPTGTPGEYAIQPGSRAQIIQPQQQSTMMTVIIVIVLLLVGMFAFKQLD